MKNNYIPLLILLYIFSLQLLFSNDSSSDINNVEDYSISDTLQFGIEAEINNLIKPLSTSLQSDNMILLLERYSTSTQPTTKIAIIQYFTRCESIAYEIIEKIYSDALNEDTDRNIKAELFYTIAKHGNNQKYSILFDYLTGDDVVLKQSASHAIRRIKDPQAGELIFNALKEGLENTDEQINDDVRNNLILSIGELCYIDAAEYLRNILKENEFDSFLIMYTMHTLAKIKDTESLALISNNLGHKEKKIRNYAAYSLSEFISPLLEPIYKEMLLNNDPDVRIYSCKGIQKNNFDSLSEILLYRYSKDPEASVRAEALKTLVLFGQSGIDAVKKVMKKNKFGNTHYKIISETLIENPTEAVVSLLVQLYHEADKKGKEIIARNVVRSNSSIVDPLIKELFLSEDYLIRLGAINAIPSIINTTLIPDLKKISLDDPTAVVKKNARRILAIIGDGIE